MNDLLKALWIVAKVLFLLTGIAGILAGGICGAIMVGPAMGHDHLAKDFLAIAAVVLVVGLVLAIPAWKSLRREHLAAKARQAAELEALCQPPGGQP